MSWLNLSHALRRDILKTAKRGPTPEQVAAERNREAFARMEAKRRAAEAEDAAMVPVARA